MSCISTPKVMQKFYGKVTKLLLYSELKIKHKKFLSHFIKLSLCRLKKEISTSLKNTIAHELSIFGYKSPLYLITFTCHNIGTLFTWGRDSHT